MTQAHISYGKLEVPVTRILPSGPLACDVSMEVLGQGFLAAYTEGDNSSVVATDTMKNVILRRALEHDEPTLEGFIHGLGRGFLERYPEMEGLRLWATQTPWVAVPVPVTRSPVPRSLPSTPGAATVSVVSAGVEAPSSTAVGSTVMVTVPVRI